MAALLSGALAQQISNRRGELACSSYLAKAIRACGSIVTARASIRPTQVWVAVLCRASPRVNDKGKR